MGFRSFGLLNYIRCRADRYIIAGLGLSHNLISSTQEDTDDAYVTGYTHQISSRITGTVEEVFVDDDWHVTAGQPLLKLDPRDYQVALEKDRASYLQAQAQLVLPAWALNRTAAGTR